MNSVFPSKRDLFNYINDVTEKEDKARIAVIKEAMSRPENQSLRDALKGMDIDRQFSFRCFKEEYHLKVSARIKDLAGRIWRELVELKQETEALAQRLSIGLDLPTFSFPGALTEAVRDFNDCFKALSSKENPQLNAKGRVAKAYVESNFFMSIDDAASGGFTLCYCEPPPLRLDTPNINHFRLVGEKDPKRTLAVMLAETGLTLDSMALGIGEFVIKPTE